MGGLVILFLILWGYFGQECLKIGQREVQFSRTIFGIGPVQSLNRSQIKNLRQEKIDTTIVKIGSYHGLLWGLNSGKIKFDYGLKTYSFGLAVDDIEANHWVQYLSDKIENQ